MYIQVETEIEPKDSHRDTVLFCSAKPASPENYSAKKGLP